MGLVVPVLPFHVK